MRFLFLRMFTCAKIKNRENLGQIRENLATRKFSVIRYLTIMIIITISESTFAASFYIDRKLSIKRPRQHRGKPLACHRCDPGSNPGFVMWQGRGRPSKVGGFPRVVRFPPARKTTKRQHPSFRERVYIQCNRSKLSLYFKLNITTILWLHCHHLIIVLIWLKYC